MDQNIIECDGFYFIYNFDSGNLGHVERVSTDVVTGSAKAQDTPDYEFNLWTRPDCAGTEFENGNRTWFYFGVQASEPNALVRFNMINLNKQGRMYSQGMAPVTRTLPGKPQWERIRDRPIHITEDNTFTLSFKYRTSENTKATTFFAFTYPFSYAELQLALNSIDMRMLPLTPPQTKDDIYYHRECLVYSLEGRRVDLLTISSHHSITNEREERLKNLFPEKQERPFKFNNKKIIFMSARVHPGETPSSFVFNGFLNLLLSRADPIAIQLRKLYVFKMIPILNPDGVARGHYRTDTRGVNLNRVYLNPSLNLHPTIYASRALIRFYHYGCEKEDTGDDLRNDTSRSVQNISESSECTTDIKKKKPIAGYKSGENVKKSEKLNKAGSNANRSSITLKQPSDSKQTSERFKLQGETLNLAEQVCDMTLRDPASQTSSGTKVSRRKQDTNLLNEQILRSTLGSTIRLSPSDELNFKGAPNPLRPLRDTLKNSISLLISSTPSVGAGSFTTSNDSRMDNVHMVWCRECRDAVARLEDSAAGAPAPAPAGGVPVGVGVGLTPSIKEESKECEHTYNSIEEYRSYQAKKFEEQELERERARSVREGSTAGVDGAGGAGAGAGGAGPGGAYTSAIAPPVVDLYFCTNCFKRYILSPTNEEIVCDSVSVTSVGVSAGDGECIRAEQHDPPAPPAPPAESDGDTLPAAPPAPAREEKTKQARGGGGGGGGGGRRKSVKAAPPAPAPREPDSNLFLYIDLHGHASKKGIFMYGNHFDDVESCVECMLLPRVMALNNLHFHFSSCNFTERNMYLKDRRDGMSREGSGRVAVLKATGLVRSYTLECNYNTGRLVNVLPPTLREGAAALPQPAPPVPPKYTPHIFEESNNVISRRMYSRPQSRPMSRRSNHSDSTAGAGAVTAAPTDIKSAGPKYSQNMNLEFLEEINPKEVGRSLGASILDLTGQHPNSRIPCSDHRNLAALRDWLRVHTKTMRPQIHMPRLHMKPSSPPRTPLYARSKGKIDERKENAYRPPPPPPAAAPPDPPPPCAPLRARLVDDKPKSLATKRRNVLTIRKPNASSKTQVGARGGRGAGGGGAGGGGGRAADDGSRSTLHARVTKRTFGRGPRAPRAALSSSSDDTLDARWGGAAPGGYDTLSGRRRPFPHAPPELLKKIRLKAVV